MGKNPSLLNVRYIRPDNRTGRPESFQVLYIDDEGQTHFSEEPAEADIYIVKPEYRTYDYNKPEERIEKCDQIRVPISKIRYTIAENAGEWGKQIIQAANDQHDFKLLNQLYKWPYAYKCDFQPEVYFMQNWYEKYELKAPRLTKAFIDIEVDMADYTIDMDHVESTAYAPVNCVTVILSETREAWTFVLRPYVPPKAGRTDEEYNKRYDMYKMQLNDHEYLMSHLEEFYNDLHESFDKTYGYINYHLREYSEEIELIADVFRLINTRKPNFCLAWNMRFDIAYLMARIQVLGYDPKSVMCHPDIPYPACSFKKDTSTFQIGKQYDMCYISSYTIYTCQMRLFSAIRKGQHTFRSLKLNSIADMILHDKKVEYEDQANIVEFSYREWIKFIKYNCKDSLLQFGIENKVNDVTAYWLRSQSNLTPYNKVFRETHLLRNARELYFERYGWVQSNNLNVRGDSRTEEDKKFYGDDMDDDDDESTYKGAINADPIWNDRVGVEVFGTRSNHLFANAIDFDMGAFYPSIKIASNLDAITMLYKAALDSSEFQSGEFSNKSCNQAYEEKDKNGNVRPNDLTGEAINSYVGGNILTFGYDWLNLPSIPDMEKMILQALDKEE